MPIRMPGLHRAGEILVARNVLAADRCAVLDGLVDDLLMRHGGDVKGCLDALSAFGRLRRELERRPAREGSWHPTLPSIPIGGMGLAEVRGRGRGQGEAEAEREIGPHRLGPRGGGRRRR